MKRPMTVAFIFALCFTLLLAPGCRKQMVTVETGEIVLCTEGEIVSDTTEEIEVRADKVAGTGVTTSVITCDFHTKLAALYDEARAAIAAGDLTAAERSLAEIAASDPTYRDASVLLSDVRSRTGSESGTAGGNGAAQPGAQTPGQPGSTPGTPGTPGADPGDSGDVPVGPIANLAHYVPDRLPGFVGQRVYSDPFVLFRDYLPETPGSIVQLAVEVEQFQDKAHAQLILEQRVREPFSTAGEDVTIGTLEGYVGVKPNYVRLGMIDRGILVSMEFYTTSSNPAEHKDAMISAARALAGQ